MADMAFIEKSERDDQSVCKKLRAAGIRVSSVYDLVNTSASYPEAIPVLLSCLDPELDANVLEGVVRALTVQEARGVAAKPLLRLFRGLPVDYEHVGSAIGNALTQVAENADFTDIASIALERRLGDVRQPFVTALGGLDHPRRPKILMQLLNDDDVAGHAIEGLRKAKAVEARSRIRPFLEHPMPWVRREARRAIEVLDREASRRSPSSGRATSAASRRTRKAPRSPG